MAVKIKLSYEEPRELYAVLKLLYPIVKSYKADKGKNGRFKRAYLDVEISEENAQKGADSPLI